MSTQFINTNFKTKDMTNVNNCASLSELDVTNLDMSGWELMSWHNFAQLCTFLSTLDVSSWSGYNDIVHYKNERPQSLPNDVKNKFR